MIAGVTETMMHKYEYYILIVTGQFKIQIGNGIKQKIHEFGFSVSFSGFTGTEAGVTYQRH